MNRSKRGKAYPKESRARAARIAQMSERGLSSIVREWACHQERRLRSLPSFPYQHYGGR